MKNLDPNEAKRILVEKAGSLGLDPVGVAPVPAELRQDYFYKWLETDQHGEMGWMARDPERRANPEQVQPGAHCILCFGLNYYQPEPGRRGRIAKYALGKDYHKVMINKLKTLCKWLQEIGATNRPYVDTGPLLEKPIAALAGIGWQGKNTMVLNGEHGQWLFLGFILTTFPFPVDKPQQDRCGTCTRCIDICPTRAITAPYQLDARKCISYLTIEHKGSIPLPYRRLMGDHLYGCDDCLDICPWNKWARKTREAAFEARDYPDLRELLTMDDDAFNNLFAGSPVRRLKRPRFLRNVCIVLGNSGTREDLPVLKKAAMDPDTLIAEHAQWAIAEIEDRG
ncbi:tRNA epoxyqueuosine(34) reductase QueG [Puniceicoccales bacterium CK1056]|uniref:tRNA epoxyqueuosine(34) reductase QueG n=1 Tax=Oceanipulchritudo coccoides TaxID=2706888 RepID=A0A6B2M384_9BACT|nr:tRNA epoxyqueuosine(34) reductase QueG [Oceanipulchritudo coccoides]NDV62160.1 tRNA epoxyqueuosine(34) reductase QueG [Oceanipulchritudo coccoides]